MNAVAKRFLIGLIRISLIYLISLVFVHLPSFWRWLISLGKDDDTSERQKRLRCQLVEPADPCSAYRAMEVLDHLENQPDEQLETLADIVHLALRRHADKQTMGVRQILDVQDEKQSNGKVFRKVSFPLSLSFSAHGRRCPDV